VGGGGISAAQFQPLQRGREIIRDDDAQKAFCKLRSAMAASIYECAGSMPAMRISLRAAGGGEFAFKQASPSVPIARTAFHYDLYVGEPKPDGRGAVISLERATSWTPQ